MIFIVDDDAQIREGLRSLLETDGQVVEDFASCEASSTPIGPVAKDASWWTPICRA